MISIFSRRTLIRLLGSMALIVALLTAYSFHLDIPTAESKHKYAGPSSRFITVDGMSVHYQDEGQGPALLLIHGSNSSLHTWRGWQDRLSQQFRVIAVDLPGHGLTGPHPSDRYDYPSMVAFIDQLSAALKIDRMSIAGNSMGGAIALSYAMSRSEKVDKLILIDALGYPEEIPPFELRAWGLPIVGKAMTVLTPRFVYAKALRDIYGHKERVDEALVDRYFELLLNEGNRRATNLRFSTPSWSVDLQRMKALNMPVLVMWGGRDPWFDPAFGARFARDLPNAGLQVFPELGHVPMEEAPEPTAAAAMAFLTAIRQGQKPRLH